MFVAILNNYYYINNFILNMLIFKILLGTFDQHSLYSCDSQVESEIDFKTCSLTWSNYSLRPSSTRSDCYYDLFQKVTVLLWSIH